MRLKRRDRTCVTWQPAKTSKSGPQALGDGAWFNALPRRARNVHGLGHVLEIVEFRSQSHIVLLAHP